MPPMLAARQIILPQAAGLALRPFGNELIMMVKASALASVVTVYDLLATAKLAFQRTYDFQAYLAAALIYIATVETIRRLWNVLDKKLNHHSGHMQIVSKVSREQKSWPDPGGAGVRPSGHLRGNDQRNPWAWIDSDHSENTNVSSPMS